METRTATPINKPAPSFSDPLTISSDQMATCGLDAGVKRPEAPACRNALVSIHYTIVDRANGDNTNIIAAYVDLVIKLAAEFSNCLT